MTSTITNPSLVSEEKMKNSSEETQDKPQLTKNLFQISEEKESLENLSTFNEQTPFQEDEMKFSPQYRHYKLLLEYKYLPKYISPGIYIVPSFESIFVWFGTIFVRQGTYRLGIFKFLIKIPQEYPEKGPEIQFFTPLYHPQVNPSTNLFNLQSEIGTWNPNQHNLLVVIKYIKNLFYNVNLENPANPEAAELFLKSRPDFDLKAKECVHESHNKVYENPENSSLKFSKWQKEHDKIKNEALKQKLEESEGGTRDFLSTVSSSLLKIFGIKY